MYQNSLLIRWILKRMHRKDAECLTAVLLPDMTVDEVMSEEEKLSDEWYDIVHHQQHSLETQIAFINQHAKIFQIADVMKKGEERLSWHDRKEFARITLAFAREDEALDRRMALREKMGRRWKDAYDWMDENW